MSPIGWLKMKVSVFLVHVVVEHVDGSSALAAAFVNLASLGEVGTYAHLLAEIALVQFLVQDGLIEFLYLTHRELLRKQFQRNGSVCYLVLKSVYGLLHHLHVVEVERRKVVGVHPLAVELFQ